METQKILDSERQKQIDIAKQREFELQQKMLRKIEEQEEIELILKKESKARIKYNKLSDGQLFEEALESRRLNHNGPWKDSNNNRWGICEYCGEFTNDYWYFDGATNICYCNKCRKK